MRFTDMRERIVEHAISYGNHWKRPISRSRRRTHERSSKRAIDATSDPVHAPVRTPTEASRHMREVLESKRLRLSWEKLSRDELTPIERTVALDGIRRILASAGHDLDSVLKMAVVGVVMLEREREEKAAHAAARRSANDATHGHSKTGFGPEDFLTPRRPDIDDAFGPGFSAFKDVFGTQKGRASAAHAYGRAASMAEKQAEERRAQLRPITGEAVPAVVTGLVAIVDRVTIKSGDMLVFKLENTFALYGPLIAMEENTIETIEAAKRHSAQIKVTIKRHPDQADVNIVERVSIAP